MAQPLYAVISFEKMESIGDTPMSLRFRENCLEAVCGYREDMDY